jgi:DNA primase
MNIKVLLLPDGDDPDSFARKHSSEELKKYIDEHQTDFITFKSRLTVENVTDPVKRSEAISGIVKSISVIPDQILRSTYLTDFSQRIGMKEQTLIAQMNKYIRKDIEDRKRDEEREDRREEITGEKKEDEAANPVLMLHTPHEQASEVETLLVNEIIRHGEELIYDNVETEDGQVVSLNVAEYIDMDLNSDNIQFSKPIYNQVLAEAVAHGKEAGFKAETYFCSHPDMEVSKLATSLAIDRHQLAGRFVMQPREGALQQRVLHLVMDLRREIVEARLKEIQQQLRQVSNDNARIMELMKEYKDTQEMRNIIAKRLGSDLVI